MSDDWPKPSTPAFSASCSGAAESVCWVEDVGALGDERLGGVRLLARIEPGVDPVDLALGVGIGGRQAALEGVDAGDDLGIGNETIYPIAPDLVILPAICPITYRPS
jgi:hypothetical protein